MHIYRVGDPYIPGRNNWPERVEYNYRSGSHELRLFLNRPSAREVRDIGSGLAEFGLVVRRPVIVLLYRFGDTFSWSDAPYTIHMVPEGERMAPPALGHGERSLLQVVLVDALTGIIRALRVVSLSPVFSERLATAIRAQLASPFDQASYDRTLDDLYREYPTSTLLLGQAIFRCVGGS